MAEQWVPENSVCQGQSIHSLENSSLRKSQNERMLPSNQEGTDKGEKSFKWYLRNHIMEESGISLQTMDQQAGAG